MYSFKCGHTEKYICYQFTLIKWLSRCYVNDNFDTNLNNLNRVHFTLKTELLAL